jgi:dipeptidase
MHSPNLFTKTKELGWQKFTNGKLDWLRTVTDNYGEYFHPYYALRRVWRAFSRINPVEKFPAWVKDGYARAYPFSIKPQKKLTPRDVMSLYRDHYEGTEFDLTKGMAAGPFGNPNRYVGPYDPTQNVPGKNKKGWGAWERPISMYYMGYSYVCQGRKGMPDPIGGVAWIGLDVAYTTCYMPFYVGAGDLPKSLQTGCTSKFDRKTAWWAFNFAANWATLKFDLITKDIRERQKEIETEEFDMQPTLEKTALELYQKNPKLACKFLTRYTNANTHNILKQWWDMIDELIVKYDDGYIHIPYNPVEEVGYPEWWLKNKDVGYEKGPITYEKPKK